MTQYYVRTDGSNSNTGLANTAGGAWLTIQKAASILVAGDIVTVGNGTYTGNINTTTSGTSGNHITFQSATLYGAKIIPPGSAQSNLNGWRNTGQYVDVIGFEFDGTNDSPGLIWTTGFYQLGGNSLVKQIHAHHIAKTLAQPNSSGGAGIVAGDESFGGTNINNTVDKCWVHDIGPNNGAQVHGVYAAATGCVVTNCLIYAIQDAGINSWHWAKNLIIVNNTLFNTVEGLIIGSGDNGGTSINANSIIRNNIVFDNVTYGINEQGTTGANTYTNNCVFQNGTNWILQNGNTHSSDITANPSFINYIKAGGGNYHLASNSPCINTGTSLNAPALDLDLTVRPQSGLYDVGAYEFISSGGTGDGLAGSAKNWRRHHSRGFR